MQKQKLKLKQKLKIKNKNKEELTVIDRPNKDYGVTFEFSDPSKIAGNNLIEVHNASFWYNIDKPLFKNIDFGISRNSRIAIVGPNGAVKNTLLKLLTGLLDPKVGMIDINRKLIVCEYAQHFIERLDGNDTPIEHLQKIMKGKVQDEDIFGGLGEKYLRKRLDYMGLTQTVPIQQIKTLSGGQKSRVVFTELALRCPHLLVFDEPTNHLDVESIEALMKALREYNGALLLISHDVRLITDICDKLWIILGDGTIIESEESFNDYRDRLVKEYKDKMENDRIEIATIRERKIVEAKITRDKKTKQTIV